MLRINFLIFLLVSTCRLANATNVGDIFISIPDSIIPYIDRESRTSLIKMKYIEPEETASLSNRLKVKMELTSLSDDMLTLKMGNVLYEIARFPTQEDSIFCMLRTIQLPEKETTGYIINKDWSVTKHIDFSQVYSDSICKACAMSTPNNDTISVNLNDTVLANSNIAILINSNGSTLVNGNSTVLTNDNDTIKAIDVFPIIEAHFAKDHNNTIYVLLNIPYNINQACEDRLKYVKAQRMLK